MSDPMARMGGMPGGGMPGGAPGGDPLAQMKSQESIFNPADAAMKVNRGDIRPDMTVAQLLGSMGIDVNGPASQLTEFMKGQVQNKTNLGKMGLGGPPGAPPGPQGGRPMAPPPEPGIAGLMGNIRG